MSNYRRLKNGEKPTWKWFFHESYVRLIFVFFGMSLGLFGAALAFALVGLGVIPISIHIEFNVAISLILIELSLLLDALFFSFLIFRYGGWAHEIRLLLEEPPAEPIFNGDEPK